MAAEVCKCGEVLYPVGSDDPEAVNIFIVMIQRL